MAVVVRYINYSFSIQQCLIRLQLLTKNMMGEEIVREIINALFVHYSIGSNLIMALMHDKAACNTVALRTLKVVYPMLVRIGCFSHTHDLVREKFCIPLLSSVTIWWVSLFSHTPKLKLLWKERTGRSFEGYSATKWRSKLEVMKQVLDLFGDVET